MPNPFNPLEWLKSSQDWFSKAERSSGFRPYLIFLLVASGVSTGILWQFGEWPEARIVGLSILAISFFAFILIYAIKAFQEPDFCRSETHVHRMKKLELEYMGSETESLPGEIIEAQVEVEAPPLLEGPDVEGEEAQ
jgi:hypothetical protein